MNVGAKHLKNVYCCCCVFSSDEKKVGEIVSDQSEFYAYTVVDHAICFFFIIIISHLQMFISVLFVIEWMFSYGSYEKNALHYEMVMNLRYANVFDAFTGKKREMTTTAWETKCQKGKLHFIFNISFC